MLRTTMSVSRRKQLNPSWTLSRAVGGASPSSIPTVFKPWHQPMIESDGDYRKEAHLEQHIVGPLY